VAALGVSGAGGVGFRPNEVADNSETCFCPSVVKRAGLRPAVKGNAKAVVFQDPVHFLAAIEQPPSLARLVIGDAAPVSVFVGDKVRRVGDDEVNARAGMACMTFRLS